MKKIDEELVQLYANMAELTLPKCRQCRVPISCCSPEYCEYTIELASEYGVILPITDHPTLKMMGPNGCTCPPHFRPNCTLHVCSINSLGSDPKDKKFTEEYFELRMKIERIEMGKLSATKKNLLS